MELIRPRMYDELTPDEKAKICNGCGTKGLGGWLVPDTLYGLDISEPCNIHDFMWYLGRTEMDMREANLTFLVNMIITILSVKYPWWKKPLLVARLHRALKYFEAVDIAGSHFFYKEKAK